jgi:hypothetical protein
MKQFAAVEKAYRRGFDQGANAVINAWIKGVSNEDIDDWLTVLHQWRLQVDDTDISDTDYVEMVDPIYPVWISIPMSEALEQWKKRFEEK